jgi:hypothetical protein
MGFNLAGFAINRNYEGDIELLSKTLFKSGKYKLFQGKNKFDLERSSVFGSTKGRMDFYFTEKGSFAFVNVMETPYILGNLNKELLKGSKMLIFAISETSMTFMFKLFIDGIKVREVQNIEGEVTFSFGEKTEVEKIEEDMTEICFALAEEIIGENILSIEPDKVFIRYVKKKV